MIKDSKFDRTDNPISKFTSRHKHKRQQWDIFSAYLWGHEFSLALLADLQKGVAGHVLHSRMMLVHKLEQFVHDGLQKLPVRTQKTRILPCVRRMGREKERGGSITDRRDKYKNVLKLLFWTCSMLMGQQIRNSAMCQQTTQLQMQNIIFFKNSLPTMYMMLLATTALLSLPRCSSHSRSRSLITLTRNLE